MVIALLAGCSNAGYHSVAPIAALAPKNTGSSNRELPPYPGDGEFTSPLQKRPDPESAEELAFSSSFRRYRTWARKYVDALQSPLGERAADFDRSSPRPAEDGQGVPAEGESKPLITGAEADPGTLKRHFKSYGSLRAEESSKAFFKGRYNRSRARLPENIEHWRSQPDIANPGPDLANFPNSAFTLPMGRAYVELSPFTYYGTALSSPAQYNAEFLLRYGLTDDIELRLFGNGVSWVGGSESSWGFALLAFDTKINLWLEQSQYFLPAAALEAYVQTQWLGSTAFDNGTQPSVMLNFDQSLPLDMDLEYNLGATRIQDAEGDNIWEFSFQWALQRDFFDRDFALFIHGFLNAASLPRLPGGRTSLPSTEETQNAVGAGFLWTVNRRLAFYGQAAGGTTPSTPAVITMLGLAASF